MVYPQMQDVELKLKQASAVLGVDPKDLQNLVQFKVLRPRRRNSFYWFDNRLLLQAKVALYLKESLGTSTDLLVRFTQALSENLSDEELSAPRYVWLRSRPTASREPIEVRIPLRSLAKELDEQMPRAKVYRDLPRGRKRRDGSATSYEPYKQPHAIYQASRNRRLWTLFAATGLRKSGCRRLPLTPPAGRVFLGIFHP
jgi:hypothetical protein